MSYDIGRFGLDYLPCRYGGSKVLFRGPRKPLDAPYIAFLGGTETYGKFVETPFVDGVERALGTTCLNLGCINAGIDVFVQDRHLTDVAAQAQATVLQVLPPQNMSNRLYSVHPRRNDRFVKPSTLLQRIYPEVDFAEFNFNRHMLTRLSQLSEDRFDAVCSELREAWIARMELLLQRISGPVVLLWLANRSPDSPSDSLGADPWFIGRPELDRLRKEVSAVVEVTASAAARAEGTQGMIFAELDRPMAERMPNPAVHEEISAQVAPVLSALL